MSAHPLGASRVSGAKPQLLPNYLHGTFVKRRGTVATLDPIKTPLKRTIGHVEKDMNIFSHQQILMSHGFYVQIVDFFYFNLSKRYKRR